MIPKTAPKFKKLEDYAPDPTPAEAPPAKPSVRETFFRLKLVPASLVQYAVEQVTVVDDVVLERKLVTERDILPITLSKVEDYILRELRR